MNVQTEVTKIYDEMVGWRRHLHEHPELSYEEVNTSKFIYEKLKEFGVDQVDYMCETAVIGLVNGTKPGKCLAIRADIDGLPVNEETGLPFASKHDNVMHACGHDGHVAMLLGTAKVLCENRDQFSGSVKLIFQHAEEKFPGGSVFLVEAGVMENPHVDAIIAAHLVPHEECGIVRVKGGDVSIGCDVVNVTITGKSGHASKPHLANDALLAACQFVVALQQIVSRFIDPKRTEIISVGTLHSGKAVNIVADKAELSMNVRSFDLESTEITKNKIYDIADGIAKITGCTVDIDYVKGYEPVINDPAIASLVGNVVEKYLGPDFVQYEDYELGSDDFSYFMNATNTPGAYFFLFAGHEGDEVYVNHHPKFSWKEEAMKSGVQIYLGTALEFLND